MKRTPQLPETRAICPRCEAPILDNDLERRGNMPAIIDGEIVDGEWAEHTRDRCGKWLWRRKKVETPTR